MCRKWDTEIRLQLLCHRTVRRSLARTVSMALHSFLGFRSCGEIVSVKILTLSLGAALPLGADQIFLISVLSWLLLILSVSAFSALYPVPGGDIRGLVDSEVIYVSDESVEQRLVGVVSLLCVIYSNSPTAAGEGGGGGVALRKALESPPPLSAWEMSGALTSFFPVIPPALCSASGARSAHHASVTEEGGSAGPPL